jgi:hypothetical protein
MKLLQVFIFSNKGFPIGAALATDPMDPLSTKFSALTFEALRQSSLDALQTGFI